MLNLIKYFFSCGYITHKITVEFLREIGTHLIMNDASCIITCYGITKQPETNNFIMVMDCAENGNVRQHLDIKFNSLSFWKIKLFALERFANGLKSIHDKGLIHHDFHCGNILSIQVATYITDLGLCRPANAKPSQDGDKKIYGVLPYVAPEVLRGKEYTQASDIYGFEIIAYEVCTGLPPYHDMAHEDFLAIKICNGERPTRSNYKIPQLILVIIKLDVCRHGRPLKFRLYI